MARENYGLIHLNKQKAKQLPISRPAIFGDSDSDEDNEGGSKKKPIVSQAKVKRQTQIDLNRALEVDPDVFEYDSIYDEMKNKKASQLSDNALSSDNKEVAVKQPKYVHHLLKHADERKKEHERRTERKIQKERELEGDEFAEKEAFVTSAYREKLKEREEWEEKDKREKALEEKMDVTKQTDLSGFYRNLLNESVRPEKEENKDDQLDKQIKEATSSKQSERKQTRQLRVRRESSSDSEEEERVTKVEEQLKNYKESKQTTVKEEAHPAKTTAKTNKPDDNSSSGSDSESENESSSEGKNSDMESKRKRSQSDSPAQITTNEVEPIVKKQKVDKLALLIEKFQKRTIGDVFEDALQRYLIRKANRIFF